MRNPYKPYETVEMRRQLSERLPECDHAARRIFRTPWGWAGVVVTESGIARLILPKRDRHAVASELDGLQEGRRGGRQRQERALIEKTANLLRKYFAGQPVLFDLPLDLRYYTFFQQQVWRVVQGIPYGETRSYGWIAKRIGRPKGARAVGQAMGANPVPLVVP